MIRNFLLIPTWLIMVLASPFFPTAHPWKRNLPGYHNWCEGATDLTVHFGFVFVTTGTTLAITLFILALQYL